MKTFIKMVLMAGVFFLGASMLQDGRASELVTVKGSDTMIIVAQRWAEEYMKKHPDATIQVTGGALGRELPRLLTVRQTWQTHPALSSRKR